LTAQEDLWKGFPGAYQERGLQKLWRSHGDAVNKALLNRWLSERQMTFEHLSRLLTRFFIGHFIAVKVTKF
jgi:hypothetical protein